MQSVWQNIKPSEFKPLKEDTKTDILIIGGGIAGILCAAKLHESGADYILIEKDRICSKTTANTTAKITAQHSLIYHKIISKYGINCAKAYLEANLEALDFFVSNSKNIDCDFCYSDSFVYSKNNQTKIIKEVQAVKRLGFEADFVCDLPIPIKTSGAIRFARQAHFHPLKFLYHISKKLNMYENTKALEFIPQGVKTEHGIIKAKKIIITTHFPLINKHGLYPIKMYQHRSYCIALSGADKINGMYVDEDKKGLSFRPYGDLLLLGGGSHRTGKTGGGYTELIEFAKNHFKSAREVSRFATQDCMTLDDIAYIGQYSKNTPDLYVATGFNKWGMTTSKVAADIICDLLYGKANKYAKIYSPSRSILHPELLINTFETSANLIRPTTPRCPHLGCALKYNREEHSWDCSCHGSRFSENGTLLDGPATDDLK